MSVSSMTSWTSRAKPTLRIATFAMLEMIFYVVTLAGAAWLLTILTGT